MSWPQGNAGVDAGKVGKFNMILLQKFMKLFFPVVQPIIKKIDNTLSYLFPEIRTWFVHFIDHTSVVISLLYKYTDRDLPDGTEEFEESGSFFEACRSDFTRIIKKIIIKVGYFILGRQLIKSFCLLIINKSPYLYIKLRTIIYNHDMCLKKIVTFSELNERERYIYLKIGGINR